MHSPLLSNPRRRPRHRLVATVLIALAMFGAACASEATTTSVGVDSDATSDLVAVEPAESAPPAETPESSLDSSDGAGSETSAPAETPDTSWDGFGQLAVFETQMHPGGSQVIIDTVNSTATQTEVSGRIVVGRDFQTTYAFDADDTRLSDSSGRTYALLDGGGTRVGPIEQGEVAPFSVAFEPLADDATEIGVNLNARADDERSPDEGRPGFSIAPTISVVDPQPEPPLPNGLAISDVAVHPTATSLNVAGIGFAENHIGVNFTAINGSSRQTGFSNGHHASFLEDDLGNRYWLKFEGSNRALWVQESQQASGVLVFAGRIDPDATSLRMIMNEEGSTVDERAIKPRYNLGPWPLDGSFVGSDQIAPLTVDETIIHANGAQFVLDAMQFSAAATTVDLTVLNTSSRQIFVNGCCNGTYILDDLGNRYLMQSPVDNDSLKIPGDEGIEGRFSFPGTIDDQASTVSLVIGDLGKPESFSADTAWPQLEFGPYPVSRQAGSGGGATAPVDFGTRTTVGIDFVQQSEASDLELIFSEFSGIEVPGGVQLTLPEGILFDSGQSRLRPGASDSIDKIIQILGFYDGDPVTVLGHTDSEGSEEFNQGLSEDRAAEVRSALVAAGGSPSLIDTEGRGELDPVEDNATESGRQANRRVEILITTTKGLPQ